MHFEIFEANVVRNYSSSHMTFHVGTADLEITGARAYWDQGCLSIAFSQNILKLHTHLKYIAEIYLHVM